PSDTPPPPPPSATPTATSTPGPYEHVIRAGDTCIGIVYEYGHLDLAVIGVMEDLNNMRDCGSLPGPGNVILVPRPTATPTPFGMDLTQTVIATNAPPMITLEAGASFSVQKYTVQADDTLSSVAILHDSSLRQICELNPLPDGLNCGGCEWQSENCCCPNPPLLSQGQEINVPAPPPTATPTPTLTGSETPTATPTHDAPWPVYPAAGSEVIGPVRLAWLTVGLLSDDEHYLVLVTDETTGTTFNAATRQLSFEIPSDYLLVDGQAHTFAWQVVVVRLGEDGFFYPSGQALPESRFTWLGWE
ncbi:MAG: LysM peptidoglycan-binding domain-containing protein, partial [Anaerolineae bacterium]|nr:LysM peptidoglycan-binding domain-containing protein [Anaerolineae bacterium]